MCRQDPGGNQFRSASSLLISAYDGSWPSLEFNVVFFWGSESFLRFRWPVQLLLVRAVILTVVIREKKNSLRNTNYNTKNKKGYNKLKLFIEISSHRFFFTIIIIICAVNGNVMNVLRNNFSYTPGRMKIYKQPTFYLIRVNCEQMNITVRSLLRIVST